MTISQDLGTIVAAKNLLQHPFYIAWTEGKLTRNHLKSYAEQYFHHVLAFPTYISAVHYNTPHLSVRQEILENLVSEEQGEKNHPALWRQFVYALGATEAELQATEMLESTQNLIATFREVCLKSPFYAGLAALYVYESQIPEIAGVKIAGLQEFYGMNEEEDYEFFSVHQQADIYHAASTLKLVEEYAVTEAQKVEVQQAAATVADALWGFLDGVYERYCQDIQEEMLVAAK